MNGGTHRTSFLVRHSSRDLSGVPSAGGHILLERSLRRSSAVELLRAVQLIDTVGTELAVAAGVGHPLDSRPVSNLESLDVLAHGDDHANTLVAGDFGSHVEAHVAPVTFNQVNVGVAETRPAELDEDLIVVGHGDRDLFDNTLAIRAGLLNNSCSLSLWDTHLGFLVI